MMGPESFTPVDAPPLKAEGVPIVLRIREVKHPLTDALFRFLEVAVRGSCCDKTRWTTPEAVQVQLMHPVDVEFARPSGKELGVFWDTNPHVLTKHHTITNDFVYGRYRSLYFKQEVKKFLQPVWVPLSMLLTDVAGSIDADIAPHPYVYTWRVTDATAARMKELETAETFRRVEKKYKLWRPMIGYHGTSESNAITLLSTGFRRKGPHMLGYGVCMATHAFSAARYAFYQGEYASDGKRIDYTPRLTDGAVMSCLLFVRPLEVLSMSNNRRKCVSSSIMEQLKSDNNVTRWRAERSQTLVDHDGIWECEGFKIALLPPTSLGKMDGGDKEHWLVRNAELIARIDVVVPFGFTTLDKKTFPSKRWEPNGRTTRMV